MSGGISYSKGSLFFQSSDFFYKSVELVGVRAFGARGRKMDDPREGAEGEKKRETITTVCRNFMMAISSEFTLFYVSLCRCVCCVFDDCA